MTLRVEDHLDLEGICHAIDHSVSDILLEAHSETT